MTITTAIKLAVAGDAHDPDLVVSLIDKSKIELDKEGKIKSGLDDQIQALRESKAFLFIQREQPNNQPQFKGISPAESREQFYLNLVEYLLGKFQNLILCF